MMKIALLTLPFHMPHFSSLGLTQIKGRLKETLKDQVDVRMFYLNHDFFKLLGETQYLFIDSEATFTCLNDWLFRSEAFDDVSDNQKEYLKRFYPDKPFVADGLKNLNIGKMIRQLIQKYQLASYDVVGINATLSLTPGLAFSRHLKKINPKIITVMGGASLYQDMGLAIVEYYPYVDYVCSGSGLIAFPKLVQELINGNEKARESIPGMFSKNNFKYIEKSSEDLDINEDIPLDYHDFLESFHRLDMKPEVKPIIMLETSRGCYWNKCTFCGLNEGERKYRLKSFDKAINEINYYLVKYDCDLWMTDSIIPRSYLKNVLPFLRIPEGRNLAYEVRADYDEEEMIILKQARLTKIQPGIESLSTPVHRLMNKGINAFQCINMLKLSLKYGLIPSWNMICGFPAMTKEMYEQLLYIIPQVVHLPPPVTLSQVRFDRHSEYWRTPEKYGLQLIPFSAYSYIYPYDEKFLENIAYFFVDKNNFSPSVELIIRYFLNLKTLIDNWIDRWQPDKSTEPPKLYYYTKDGCPYIYDSRKEPIKDYRLSSYEDDILRRLEKPNSIDMLKTSPPEGMMEKDIISTIRSLANKGLVFKEEGQYMSLVLWNTPAV